MRARPDFMWYFVHFEAVPALRNYIICLFVVNPGIWYSSAKLELPQNVQNITWSHKLYRENYENLESGIDSSRKKLNCNKDPKRYFQGDALSPLLFINALMPLNHILRKCTAGYKLSRSQEKINHLMYIDDIKLFAKNEKELEALIQSGHRNGIWHRKMCNACNEKWQTTCNWRNGTTKSKQD